MTAEEYAAIRCRAVMPRVPTVPGIGPSRDRALNVATYLHAFAAIYVPANEELLADHEAIVDVVRRMDEAEADRRALLAELDRLRAEGRHHV